MPCAGDTSTEAASQPAPKLRLKNGLQNGKAHHRQQSSHEDGGLQNGVPTFDVLSDAVDSRYALFSQ